MKTLIPLWYPLTPRPGNLGDVISDYILHALGYDTRRVERNQPKWLAAGSVARFARAGDTVWGSGIISRGDTIHRGADWLAVRGPITGNMTGCNVYGDPGILCGRLWPVTGTAQRTCVPHYIDEAPDGIEVVSPITGDPVGTAMQIGCSESVVSSSLHGIIIAHGYGVPAGWWRPSDRLSGDDVKFEDYARSLDIELVPSKNIDDVQLVLPDKEAVADMQDRLIAVLP